jgi:hypothetical protein
MKCLSFGVLALMAACDQWALSINSGGVLSITITSDGFHYGDRYRLRARQSGGATRVFDLPPSGQLTRDIGVGLIELTLLAPDRCRVSVPNPRTLTVGADEVIRVAFDVRCVS